MANFGILGWTGASGQQIGFVDSMPKPKYDAFTADPVHGEAYDPNSPNTYAQPGMIGEVPVNIQDEYELIDYGMGMNGWVIDDLPMSTYSDRPGTTAHDMPIGAAGRRERPDATHMVDIYQLSVPGGHGVDFYGKSLEQDELQAWMSSSTPAPNTKTFPAQAREDTGNWPEPFDSVKYAPLLNVVRLTERIGMRRLVEDDRPMYRQLAVPGQNIVPSGSVYNPTYASNPTLQNRKPIPSFGRTPIQPWVSQEIGSPDVTSSPDENMFGELSLQ